jgi:hypothetical protein
LQSSSDENIAVDKFTIAALNTILKFYFQEDLFKKSPVFAMLKNKRRVTKLAKNYLMI